MSTFDTPLIAAVQYAGRTLPTGLRPATMFLESSHDQPPADTETRVANILASVSVASLRRSVQSLAYPRHYTAEADGNRQARDWLAAELQALGYAVRLQGDFDNVLALPARAPAGDSLLLGAHYDTVPGCPGADDNASAVAVCLECARALRACHAALPLIVLFNREEDGLLGSRDFVRKEVSSGSISIAEAHIFEMVGYRSSAPGSQTLPTELPFPAPERGNFLGLLASSRSTGIADTLLRLARAYLPDLPVLALKVPAGIEGQISHLLRSDHTPFWEAGVPTLMWTDTAEFRNPHYHRATDTLETLDGEFMAQTTRLALARLLTQTPPGGR